MVLEQWGLGPGIQVAETVDSAEGERVPQIWCLREGGDLGMEEGGVLGRVAEVARGDVTKGGGWLGWGKDGGFGFAFGELKFPVDFPARSSEHRTD